MDIGKTIAELRTASNMSQQALADSLFVSRDLVSKWENGARRPDYPTIERIAEVFDVRPDDILKKDEYLFEELAECIPADVEISEEKLTDILNVFLKKLRPGESDIFILRYYHLKSAAEVASAYGIKENHVRSSLSKTRKKLKKFVKESTL